MVKLQQIKSKDNYVRYQIVLPKQLIEMIAHWPKGISLDVEWIENGNNTVMDKPHFRISKTDL